ncbi:hypothetical protein WJX81_007769 [Elliptochloris bilobata]|uniref:Protein kinase domain-containing protein n=1 Tax=Elliptochloris bilobata TaxID=381761 RepID=A0AAW1RK74_9CHLO
MANRLAVLPEEIGNLSALYRLGLKGNKLTALPASVGTLVSLVELFITDNQLAELPAELGQCSALVKVQASFNRLTSLPRELARLPRLEMLRVAVCNITEVPAELAALPAMCWVSLAGNPACALPPPRTPAAACAVAADELAMGAPLGAGASGDVFAATWEGRSVAVKVFRGDVSPDGQMVDEVDIACALDHPNLTRVLATMGEPAALVLARAPGRPLAAKPDLVSLLRCRWAPGAAYAPAWVARVAAGVAAALAHLHSLGVCHGDVYAHNVMADAAGTATLLDYGASFCYEKGAAAPYQAQEVRAFGLLLADLVARLASGGSSAGDTNPAAGGPNLGGSLGALAGECLAAAPTKRPTFPELAARLQKLVEGLSGSAGTADSASSLLALEEAAAAAAPRAKAQALVSIK